eukprot:756749-Hanusia_phi.AAC.3
MRCQQPRSHWHPRGQVPLPQHPHRVRGVPGDWVAPCASTSWCGGWMAGEGRGGGGGGGRGLELITQQGVLNTVIYSASSVSRIAECLQDALPEGSYFRFSPEGDAFDVPLDQTNRAKIEELQSATHQYISLHAGKFLALSQRLHLPRR